MSLDLSVAMLVKHPPMDRMAALIEYLGEIASEFVIVDTGSSVDSLRAMASWNKHPFGLPKVKIIQAEFEDDFGKARNIGVDAASRAWTLVVDPDELPSIRMVGHVRSVVEGSAGNPTALGYLYWTRNYWQGILEPEAEFHWHVRLFRTGRGRFYRALDELVELDGRPEHETRTTPVLPKAPKAAYLIHSKSDVDTRQSAELYDRLRKQVS